MGAYTHVSSYLILSMPMEINVYGILHMVVCMCVHLSVSVTCTMYRLLVVFIAALESPVSLILGEH